MENIAHTLAGFAMARAGLERTTRLATAALVLGSNLPDIDSIAALQGKVAYIQAHRGITHSLLGGVVLGLALGALLYLFDRAFLAPGRPPREGARLGPLVGVSLLAVFGHLAFDGLNDYGMRWLLPFSARWYYHDLIFIVDPWFWLMLGGALHLARSGGWKGEALAWLGWAVLSVPVLLDRAAPPAARGIWVAGLLVLGAIRAVRVDFSRRRLVPRAAFVALGFYCLAVYGARGAAGKHARAEVAEHERGSAVSRLSLIPRPANPLRWNVLYESRGRIVVGSVSALPEGEPALHPVSYEMNLDHPDVRRALATPTGRAASGFCRYLFADLIETPQGTAVAFRDARFAARGRREFSVFVVPPGGAEPSEPSLR